MMYLPDVKAYGLEELPDPDRFFLSSKGLMIRWFGNMMRTSGRAIALGPKKSGFFTWWALVDHHLSALLSGLDRGHTAIVFAGFRAFLQEVLVPLAAPFILQPVLRSPSQDLYVLPSQHPRVEPPKSGRTQADQHLGSLFNHHPACHCTADIRSSYVDRIGSIRPSKYHSAGGCT